MFRSISILCASAVALAPQLVHTAHANSIQGASASCSATSSDGEGVASGGCNTYVAWPPSIYPLTSIVSGDAQVTVDPSNPYIEAKVYLSQAANPYPFGLGYSSASGTLTYYLMVTPVQSEAEILLNIPGYSGTVLVNTVVGAAVLGSGTGSASVSIADNIGNEMYGATTVYGGLQHGTELSLVADEQYQVTLSVSTSVQQISGDARAYADPMFTIDPLYAPDFQLVLSPGVGNSDVPPTPIPAALPLFVCGLAIIGWICRPRKAHAPSSPK
jgi:hypothetical protein